MFTWTFSISIERLRHQHPIEPRDAKLIIEYRLVNREYRQCLVFFLSISSGSDLNHLSILRHHRFSTNIVSICTIKSMKTHFWRTIPDVFVFERINGTINNQTFIIANLSWSRWVRYFLKNEVGVDYLQKAVPSDDFTECIRIFHIAPVCIINCY